jgi:hypothetical protein
MHTTIIMEGVQRRVIKHPWKTKKTELVVDVAGIEIF